MESESLDGVRLQPCTRLLPCHRPAAGGAAAPAALAQAGQQAAVPQAGSTQLHLRPTLKSPAATGRLDNATIAARSVRFDRCGDSARDCQWQCQCGQEPRAGSLAGSITAGGDRIGVIVSDSGIGER